jgi:hypothetical protein
MEEEVDRREDANKNYDTNTTIENDLELSFPPSIPTEEEALVTEWGENLTSIQTEPKEVVGTRKLVKLNYIQSELFFKNSDLSMHSYKIRVRDEHEQGLMTMFSFNRPVKLSIPDSENALSLPFLIAQIDYDPTIQTHITLLEGIYCFLTGNVLEAITGRHWERVGFQGLNPQSDLNRSMKMLTLLQTAHMCETQPELAQKLYTLSLLDMDTGARPGAVDRSWPFMCVSIGFTKNALGVLRSGALNKQINKSASVLDALHAYHHACFLRFGHLLEAAVQTDHNALHLSKIRDECDKKPLNILRDYKKWIKSGCKFNDDVQISKADDSLVFSDV